MQACTLIWTGSQVSNVANGPLVYAMFSLTGNEAQIKDVQEQQWYLFISPLICSL